MGGHTTLKVKTVRYTGTRLLLISREGIYKRTRIGQAAFHFSTTPITQGCIDHSMARHHLSCTSSDQTSVCIMLQPATTLRRTNANFSRQLILFTIETCPVVMWGVLKPRNLLLRATGKEKLASLTTQRQ